MGTQSKLSVVVPVYKEEESIAPFLLRLTPILASCNLDFEVIFALDPSDDQTEAVIREHHAHDPRIKLLKFSRRFGQPAAVLGGLSYATGDAVVVMDVDQQDPPELIGEMIARWRDGYDVVYAQRRSRAGETLTRRALASVGYKVISRLAEVEIPKDTGEFRLITRRVVDEVLKLKERHNFLRGMVPLVGFRQTAVLFDRPARFAGQTHYSRLIPSLKHGMDGIVGFSNSLLSLATIFGFVAVALALLLGASTMAWTFFGEPPPFGNATLVVLILFLGGVQLVSVGILGAYIGRIYDEVKQRPRFILDESLGFEDRAEMPLPRVSGRSRNRS